jgi:hypothetical protein
MRLKTRETKLLQCSIYQRAVQGWINRPVKLKACKTWFWPLAGCPLIKIGIGKVFLDLILETEKEKIHGLVVEIKMTGNIGNPGIETKNPNTEMSKMTGDFHQRIEKHLITGVLAKIKAEITEGKTVSHRDLLGMIVETRNMKGEILVTMVEMVKNRTLGGAFQTELGIGQLVKIKKGNNHLETQIVSGVVDHTYQAVAKNMIFTMGHPVQNVNFYIQLLITKAKDKIHQ